MPVLDLVMNCSCCNPTISSLYIEFGLVQKQAKQNKNTTALFHIFPPLYNFREFFFSCFLGILRDTSPLRAPSLPQCVSSWTIINKWWSKHLMINTMEKNRTWRQVNLRRGREMRHQPRPSWRHVCVDDLVCCRLSKQAADGGAEFIRLVSAEGMSVCFPLAHPYWWAQVLGVRTSLHKV